MSTISHSQRYWPHEISTKFYAVKLYRSCNDAILVCRRYHISRSSLFRWNKLFDGTRNSLVCKSHRPLSVHPNAHSEEEIKWICNYHRRNPYISICELYGKLRNEKGYYRHPGSLYRVFIRLGFRKASRPKVPVRHNKPYNTPDKLGIKWQLDVKYVPRYCYSGSDGQKFYQYTVIDEASRERFIYPYQEQSSFSTIDFVKRAISYFGYKPLCIQTDNGQEFTHLRTDKRIHPMDILCMQLNIQHQLIRPRTPWHNGKVERSHRNDQERFYNHLAFYSYEDLVNQMKSYRIRSNHTPMTVLNWLSPIQMRHKLKPV